MEIYTVYIYIYVNLCRGVQYVLFSTLEVIPTDGRRCLRGWLHGPFEEKCSRCVFFSPRICNDIPSGYD